VLNYLPFQDMETELLPWLDDMARYVATESGKPVETPADLVAKIAAVNDLALKVEAQKMDIEDVVMYGESALELVTSYDQDNMCQSAIDLGVHIEDVQNRYVGNIISA